MFNTRSWSWLNNDWFKEFDGIRGVSIGKTMRNQLQYDVEQTQKGYQIALKAAQKTKEESSNDARNQLHYDVEEWQTDYQKVFNAAEKMKKERDDARNMKKIMQKSDDDANGKKWSWNGSEWKQEEEVEEEKNEAAAIDADIKNIEKNDGSSVQGSSISSLSSSFISSPS